MLLRTVDKHLICTVFTAPIILDIVIFTKSTMQKSHLCKKIYLLLLHIYYYGTAMKFGSVIYICNFLKEIYTTPQLFLEECSSYTLLYSLLQYFHQFFSITLLQITPKIFQVTILTSHLNLYTLTHYLIYYLLYIYVKKEKNIENLKIFYSIIIFTLFTSNFSMILYIYDIWVTRKQNRHFELYYSLLDCKGLV